MSYDLVFEGGGAKGMVFVGAMQEFLERGNTYARLLGTSAGAITATFLAAEYTPEEMLVALNERENDQPVFAGFMGQPVFDETAIQNSTTLAFFQKIDLPLIPDFIDRKLDYYITKAMMSGACNLFSLIERGGWFAADKFIDWLKRKLSEGSFQGKPRNFSDMTMNEFHVATNRELSLVTSDTTGQRMLILNHQTTPDLPLVWAVRMSMSIPLVWPEVPWLAEWGKYRDKEITDHLMVDGGLLSNFPIELFVSENEHTTRLMGQQKGDQVLGLLIDEAKEVKDAPAPAAASNSFDFGQFQMIQRINRLINTATSGHDKTVIEAFENIVLRLPAKGYGTTEFDMDDQRRGALVAAGRKTMQEFLDLPLAFAAQELDVMSHADHVANQILEW